MRTIRAGDRGDDVRDVQHRLTALGSRIDPPELEGQFGSSTEAAVRGFQQRRGFLVDGRVGPETWNGLVEAGYSLGDRVLYFRYPMFRGDDVLALQRRLNTLGFDAGREDGIFGERCDRAVREFQRNVGMRPDGIVGPESVHELVRVAQPDQPGGAVSGAVVREREAVSRLNATLEGARVAIDAGHGSDDPGAMGLSGTSEADAAFGLAVALAEELARRGAEPNLLRHADENPTPEERAERANQWGAEVCVSLHLNEGDPAAEGAMCLYYGHEESFSPAGHRLAELVMEELVTRLGLTDGRTHPMTITILRETRMPAVQVEPCFLTNPREARLLGEEAFRHDLAIALANGVQRFFGAQAGVVAPEGNAARA
ncbi:MAG: N-acetylmuramoyl-L-alanine amidase [Actinomycetota bacterium]|nr:N-acetylmuramoyl-L-alanine amidase [Actinomycetota bacterium]